MSQDEQDTEALRRLTEQGVWRDGQTLKPWHTTASRKLHTLSSSGMPPFSQAQALLDFVVACAIDDAIDRLVKSSDENTETMAKLAQRLNWLTGVAAAAAVLAALGAAASGWAAFHVQPIPAPQVLVQPVISMPTPPSPAVSPMPSPSPGAVPHDSKPKAKPKTPAKKRP